jgi:hypothetical protein
LLPRASNRSASLAPVRGAEAPKHRSLSGWRLWCLSASKQEEETWWWLREVVVVEVVVATMIMMVDKHHHDG